MKDVVDGMIAEWDAKYETVKLTDVIQLEDLSSTVRGRVVGLINRMASGTFRTQCVKVPAFPQSALDKITNDDDDFAFDEFFTTALKKRKGLWIIPRDDASFNAADMALVITVT